MSWQHWGFTQEPQSPLTLRENANEYWLVDFAYHSQSHSPCIRVELSDRCIHSSDFCFGTMWNGDLHKALSSLWKILWVSSTVRTAVSLSAVIPLGTSIKRANYLKEQIMDGSRLFKDAVPSMSSWMWSLPVFWWRTWSLSSVSGYPTRWSCSCGWLMRLLWKHGFTAISPLFCKEKWHPLHSSHSVPFGSHVILLVRSLGLPAFHLLCPLKIRCQSQHRGMGYRPPRLKIRRGCPLRCCSCCWIGPRVDGHACPGSREYRAGGQQTAQSWALSAGWLVSWSGTQLTTTISSAAFLHAGILKSSKDKQRDMVKFLRNCKNVLKKI